MTELEALRRVAEAAQELANRNLGRVVLSWYELSEALSALSALDALPAPQPTPDRPQALEALYAVVRDYDRGTGHDVRWSDVIDALAAVDDSPAPAAEPEGEVENVCIALWRKTETGEWCPMMEGTEDEYDLGDGHWNHIATIRARVPLPRVPEVVGEVG